jgi:hypothetical protein
MKPGTVVGWDETLQARKFVKGPSIRSHVDTQLYLNNVIKPLLGDIPCLPMEGLDFQGKYFIRMQDLSDSRRPLHQREWRGTMIPIMGPSPEQRKLPNAPKPWEYGSMMFQDWLEQFPESQWSSSIPLDVRRQYIRIILYRAIFGVSDTNNRNIFVVKNPETGETTLYSVDETRMDYDMPNAKWLYACSRAWFQQVMQWFKDEQAWIQEQFNKWQPLIPPEFASRFDRVTLDVSRISSR